MGRGSSKLGAIGQTSLIMDGYNAETKAFLSGLAKEYAKPGSDLYASDVREAIQDYLGGNSGNLGSMMDNVMAEAKVIQFGGSTKTGDSISGKAFDANDFKTWGVGTNVVYNVDNTNYGAKIVAVNKAKGEGLVAVSYPSGNGVNYTVPLDSDTSKRMKPKK